MYGTAIHPPSLIYLLHAACDACGAQYCRGCFKSLACKSKCKGKERCEVMTCCAEVRAIALFEALGGFDRNYLSFKLGDSHNTPRSKKPQPSARTTGARGTGYGAGGGHGGGAANSGASRDTKLKEREAYDTSYDKVFVRALQTIASLLPNPASEAVYDLLPHPSIRPLIQLSFIPEAFTELLRNDSLNEWTRRSDAYHEMIQIIRKFADSELSVEVLVEQGWEKRRSDGIDEFLWGTGELSFGSKSSTQNVDLPKDFARTPPLYEHFKRLVRQCQTFLSFTSAESDGVLRNDAADAEIEDSTFQAQAICLDIIQSRDDIVTIVENWRRRHPVASASDRHEAPTSPLTRGRSAKGKGKALDPSLAMERSYTLACEKLAFAHARLSNKPGGTELGLKYSHHKFSSSITASEGSTRIPKHRFHWIKELSVMATSLPPGIWVRVDEVRNDVL